MMSRIDADAGQPEPVNHNVPASPGRGEASVNDNIIHICGRVRHPWATREGGRSA
jgi:hypothetical protein